MIEIKVPTVGESISEVTRLKWVKNDGDYVERDAVIAELESEKATFAVNADQAGLLKTIAKEGDTWNIGSVLASIDDKAEKPAGSTQPAEGSEATVQPQTTNDRQPVKTEPPAANNQQPTPQAPATPGSNDLKATPVASAIIADKKVDPA